MAQGGETQTSTSIIANAQEQVVSLLNDALYWLSSPAFYVQIILIAACVLLARVLAGVAKTSIPLFATEPVDGKMLKLRKLLFDMRQLLYRLFAIGLLEIAKPISLSSFQQDGIVRVAQGLFVVWLIFSIVNRYAKGKMLNFAIRWVGIPIAVLSVLGLLDDVSKFLDGISLELGSIHLSLLVIARLAIFGSLLFWVGRLSNNEGKKIIRQQEHLDVGTREVFSKLFEFTLFTVIFLLVLQIGGMDLTTLAVFGGALGVGLGFGLQQIAANFISGIIILLDRSLTIGDYVELEDGRSGFLSNLSMRSATLETFDGKDIMVPNDQFITTAFVNWTHKDPRQRYEFEFVVSYDTDLDKAFGIILPVVEAHPQVLSEPEMPDIEIREFGEYGIKLGIEFWADGIDDGENKFTPEIMLAVWRAMRESEIDFAIAQRMISIEKV